MKSDERERNRERIKFYYKGNEDTRMKIKRWRYRVDKYEERKNFEARVRKR